MTIEIKTQWDLWKEIDKEESFPQDNWIEKWTSNKSLILRLKEALNKTADSSKIVEVKRIIKELEGK